MKNKYSDFTLKDIEKAMKEFYSKAPPDVVIDHDGSFFSARINGCSMKVGTGYEGLKMYLNNPLPLLKIQYNGRILTEEEINQMKLQLKEQKSALTFKL